MEPLGKHNNFLSDIKLNPCVQYLTSFPIFASHHSRQTTIILINFGKPEGTIIQYIILLISQPIISLNTSEAIRATNIKSPQGF